MDTNKTTSPEASFERKKRNTLKDYFALMPVLTYFFQKRKSKNFNIKMMHGINKISILMFLMALIVWLIKRFA